MVSWPRRRRISSMALNRSPLVSQNWGEQPEYSQAPTAPVGAGHTHSLSCPRPAAPPLPSPSSPGHTPSSTMRSPSLSEAPCPAQVLFIWATRARLLFSMVSSSSLAAGLQTHTPLSECPAQGHRGGEPPAHASRLRDRDNAWCAPGMSKVLSPGSTFTPKFNSRSQQDTNVHTSYPAPPHLGVGISINHLTNEQRHVTVLLIKNDKNS